MINDKKKKLYLDEDLYCYVFSQLASGSFSIHEGHVWFRKCFMVFFLQLFLLLAYLFAGDDLAVDEGKNFLPMCIRLSCAFILHLVMLTEINTSLSMLSFLKHQDEDSAVGQYAMCYQIAIMKYVACVMTELINIVIICQSDNIQDIIKDFISLGFIIELDDLFAQSIVGKKELE